jgi:REP element-mobilizing transposase RayT
VPDSLHHVTARGSADELIFREPADRRRFVQQLRRVVADHRWRCNAYCLMGTHFHLLVYTVDATLSAGMALLLGDYARWFNWKYDRHGHLFGGRFAWQHIVEDAHLLEAHRYVALNPVRAQHCDDPAEWRWGSYRVLAGLEPAPDFLDVDAVHRLFSGRRGEAALAYRMFVRDGLERLGSDPCGVRPL